MKIIRNKLLAIKSSTHSRENKYSNRQIEQTRNEQRLSSERRNISDDTMEMEKFSETKHINQ
jgi:hypothetical protein